VPAVIVAALLLLWTKVLMVANGEPSQVTANDRETVALSH